MPQKRGAGQVVRDESLAAKRVDHRLDVVRRRLPPCELQHEQFRRDDRYAIDLGDVALRKSALFVNDETGALRAPPTEARDLDDVDASTRRFVEHRGRSVGSSGSVAPGHACCTHESAMRLGNTSESVHAVVYVPPTSRDSMLDLMLGEAGFARLGNGDDAVLSLGLAREYAVGRLVGGVRRFLVGTSGIFCSRHRRMMPFP